ncbi:MAG: dihydrolipoyl dehydrogenase [Gammaproteobacteria bacterium]|nr:dihydrolipoyl dehydrogenase [Gammaproteobacteria bacterium]
MTKTFDIVVIGAGPAGYSAAIRAAQLGMSVACIDNNLDSEGNPTLGGTCLNVGCIPSKALLDVSHKFHESQHYGDIGIEATDLSLNLAAVMKHKDSVVNQLTSGIGLLLQGNKVEAIEGTGYLASENVVVTDRSGNTEELNAEHIILAPGSIPIQIPSAVVDEENIVDSTGALKFSEVPKRLGVIGAGIIGLELGSVWNRFGSDVVILEALDDFLPMADARIARDAKRQFTNQGMDIRLGSLVTDSKVNDQGEVVVTFTQKEEEHQLVCDKLIVAVGRAPNTDKLFSPESLVQLDERGFIFVNEFCETDAVGVYAVGDAVRGPMLAHKGMEEGVMVAERIAGNKPLVNYDCVPSVIYTHPEIAWVGESEQSLKGDGIEIRSGTFLFSANGRALAANDATGIVKVIADAESDSILGMHVFGPSASELVAQGVIAMEMGSTAEDLALTMFAHPTLSEAVHEAALGVAGNAIHTLNRPSRK